MCTNMYHMTRYFLEGMRTFQFLTNSAILEAAIFLRVR